MRIELWMIKRRPLRPDFTGVLYICKRGFCLCELPYRGAQRPDIDFQRIIRSTIKAEKDQNPSETEEKKE